MSPPKKITISCIILFLFLIPLVVAEDNGSDIIVIDTIDDSILDDEQEPPFDESEYTQYPAYVDYILIIGIIVVCAVMLFIILLLFAIKYFGRKPDEPS